ncbi:DNA recombination protein [Bacteroidales bacterium]|nr:DNA recombination protein [Bacteroidales bacterium]
MMNIVFILLSFLLGALLTYLVASLRQKKSTVDKELFYNQNDLIASLQRDIAILETRQVAVSENLNKAKTLLSQKEEMCIYMQDKINAYKQEIAEMGADYKNALQRIKEKEEIEQKKSAQLEILTEQIKQMEVRESRLTSQNEALEEKLSSHKAEIIEMQKTAHLQFEKIVNKILEDKSGKITEPNKVNIEALLKPLSENISVFKQKVEETYDKESKQRFSLEEKVKDLVEQNNKVSAQAKTQGNWGEMILESILEKSGLLKDKQYRVQPTIQNEDGKNQRPDVIVELPDRRIIIIDSKASLVAYERFASAQNSSEQSLHMAEHLLSIRKHIDDLQGKNYDNLTDSLDFTMMFVSIEPAYMFAIQADPELWDYAYSKRILLISPTNLIACLKLISDLWKREMQSNNAMEIVKHGELLYEKFVSFGSSLEDVGKHLQRTQTAYATATSQLNRGSGLLVGAGYKAQKPWT